VRKLLSLMLRNYQTVTMLARAVPATEQALVTLLLSRDRKLVRDRGGKWNHRDSPRLIRYTDGKGDGFNYGFNDRTIEKLIEAGHVSVIHYDVRARPIEVKWVRIN
jgi:hypothetical protein